MLKKRKTQKNILIGYVSDKGAVRDKNQDRVLCMKAKIGGYDMTIACVCDGIGSLANSEISSAMVIDGLKSWFYEIQNHCYSDVRPYKFVEEMEQTIRNLNELVFQYRDKYNMDIGCTLSLFFGIGRKYYVFHAGDSRVYCYRDTLIQLTHDEATAKETEGRIRNYLANYIGKSQNLWISKFSGDILDDDLYIICSDGLYKRMVDEDIVRLKMVKRDKVMMLECRKLIENMIERGETDNISCAALYYGHKKRLFLK